MCIYTQYTYIHYFQHYIANFEMNCHSLLLYHKQRISFLLESTCIDTLLTSVKDLIVILPIYASPCSGEAFRDRQLNTKFEFWVEFFCVPSTADMFPYEDSKTVSVCPYSQKRSYPGFVNISPTIVITDTSMERCSWVLQHGNPKIWIIFQKSSKLNFDL